MVLASASSYANDILLPIQVTIIQCGKPTEVIKRCAEEEKCCVFLDSTNTLAAQGDTLNDTEAKFTLTGLKPELTLE